MKKIIAGLLFSLFSISLFAGGHGTNALKTLFELIVGIIIYSAVFIVLTVLSFINLGTLKKTLFIICISLLSILTIIFIYYFSRFSNLFDSAGQIDPYYELPRYDIYALRFFVLLFGLNVISLSITYVRIKEKKSQKAPI